MGNIKYISYTNKDIANHLVDVRCYKTEEARKRYEELKEEAIERFIEEYADQDEEQGEE